MKSFKIYQGIALPKNQAILVDFIQTGSNEFWKAYYMRTRKIRVRPTRELAAYFNRQLKRIQKRGLLLDIPFVLYTNDGTYIWQNPGVKGSKANFQALTLHSAVMKLKSQINKIL